MEQTRDEFLAVSAEPSVSTPTSAKDGTIHISDWKPFERGALRGFFDVLLPSGLILHGCSLAEKDGKRWVNPPQRQIKNGEKTRYEKTVSFVDRETSDKFNKAVVAALDEFLRNIGR